MLSLGFVLQTVQHSEKTLRLVKSIYVSNVTEISETKWYYLQPKKDKFDVFGTFVSKQVLQKGSCWILLASEVSDAYLSFVFTTVA